MESRIRRRTLSGNTFEHFLVVEKVWSPGSLTSTGTKPYKHITRFSFPTQTSSSEGSAELYKAASHFAFPEDKILDGIEHFTFVLTDGAGKWTFGYCRHQPEPGNTEKAFVFLSPIPYAEGLFYKALNSCAKLGDLARNGRGFLQALHRAGSGNSLGRSPVSTESQFSLPPPYGSVLPTTLDNRCLSEFYNSFTTKSMVLILASLLAERKILVTSGKLSRLSSVVLASNLILYPLCWQHLFIPVLPEHLGEYLEAPVPFIIGVPVLTFKKVRPSLADTVYVDADRDSVTSPFPEDLTSLPPGISSFLKKHLAKDKFQGTGLARTFLRVFVKLMGHYELALSPAGGRGFDSERFIRKSKPSRRSYIRNRFMELQMFQQFIEERSQAGFNCHGADIFQNEIDIDKPGKCMRRRITSLKPPGGIPTFITRRIEDSPHGQGRRPFTDKNGNGKPPSNRVTFDPAIMSSWNRIMTEFQTKTATENKLVTSASAEESQRPPCSEPPQASPEKFLIDFDSAASLTAAGDANGVDLLLNAHPTASEAAGAGQSESTKTIELLKKYGLYEFYANDPKL